MPITNRHLTTYCGALVSVFHLCSYLHFSRQTALELEIPHGQQQFQVILLASHQDGTKQGRRCSHATWVAFPCV